MHVVLSDDLQSFVASVVREGVYSNESEVLSEALRLLRSREQLRHDVQAGVQQLDQGQFDEYGEADRDRFLADVRSTDTPSAAGREE
ncbi:MAG: type II toxin-antitoxin system ParD family antitoxin [Thermoguttaceae bacterium]|jgi:putative addiction module CopG family antidote|nr:type II toxin-antitoxin system ParD family antitoxin [Thermoguttaceae bacterium]